MHSLVFLPMAPIVLLSRPQEPGELQPFSLLPCSCCLLQSRARHTAVCWSLLRHHEMWPLGCMVFLVL